MYVSIYLSFFPDVLVRPQCPSSRAMWASRHSRSNGGAPSGGPGGGLPPQKGSDTVDGGSGDASDGGAEASSGISKSRRRKLRKQKKLQEIAASPPYVCPMEFCNL